MTEDDEMLRRLDDLMAEDAQAMETWRANHYWTLDEHGEPVSCPDVIEWGRWMERSKTDNARIVAQDQAGPWYVSTVFLGLNHDFLGYGPPILWETMIFSQLGAEDSIDTTLQRYTSREDAIDGHARILAELRAGRIP